MQTISIQTRVRGGAYHAKSGKIKASSTSSEENAAGRVAMKCFRVPGKLERLNPAHLGIKLKCQVKCDGCGQGDGIWMAIFEPAS